MSWYSMKGSRRNASFWWESLELGRGAGLRSDHYLSKFMHCLRQSLDDLGPPRRPYSPPGKLGRLFLLLTNIHSLTSYSSQFRFFFLLVIIILDKVKDGFDNANDHVSVWRSMNSSCWSTGQKGSCDCWWARRGVHQGNKWHLLREYLLRGSSIGRRCGSSQWCGSRLACGGGILIHGGGGDGVLDEKCRKGQQRAEREIMTVVGSFWHSVFG